MTKKETQAYKRGKKEMLLSITGLSIWIVMFITYSYIKFL